MSARASLQELCEDAWEQVKAEHGPQWQRLSYAEQYMLHCARYERLIRASGATLYWEQPGKLD